MPDNPLSTNPSSVIPAVDARAPIERHEQTLKIFELTLRCLEDHERLLQGFVAQEVPLRTVE
jgi:hypothetical protein